MTDADGVLVVDLDAEFDGYEHVDEWYITDYGDHIYPTCPALKRSGQARRGQGRLYPEAGDVCGWCLRVWRSRQQTEASAVPEKEET